MSLLLFAKKKFNPRNWFAKGEPGAWYDPSDLTTLFQESTGVTPMAAVGTVQDQPVGLMLDKSKGLTLGAELVTNGDFSNGTTGWTATDTQAVASGEMIVSGTSATKWSYQSVSTIVGMTYQLGGTRRGGTGSAIIWVGTGSGTNSLGVTSTVTAGNAASNQLIFTATTTTTFIQLLAVGAGLNAYFDNISVKQIAGNHAFQVTSANRPILSSRVNLLTKTEDFSAAVWAPQSATINGNVLSTPTAGSSQIFQSTAAFGNFTFSVKLSGVGTCSIFAYQSSVLGEKQITLTSTPTIYSTTFTTTAGSNVYIGRRSGDTATSITLWGADLRPTNSGALLPPYQRVNTVSDYDSVGFPLYLKCNGLQSAMSTNSIDFTATDKMTVVTGIRKLSGSIGMLLELSVDTSVNNGSFWYLTNIGSDGYNVSAGGTSHPSINSVIGASPTSSVCTLLDSISTPLLVSRLNGTQIAMSSAPQGIGSFGNYPLYLFARNQSQYLLNGQFYGAIIRGAQSDTASVTQTEQYMATKTGITF
jgi:hypothetical protein